MASHECVDGKDKPMGKAAVQAEGLRVSEESGILTLAFDRAERRNAITYDMYETLTTNLMRAEDDSDIRCVVLTGMGSIFTAGHDVAGFSRGLALAVEEKPSFGFMRALSECPAPIIAAVNGDAVGIGATMLLHCDLVYAVPDARLVYPFMNMGLLPEFGSTHCAPRLVGHQRAMELFLLKGNISVEEALAWGMINAILPAEELTAAARGAASRIASLSHQAVRETKRLTKANDTDTIRRAISQEAHGFHELLQTDFVKDRLAAIGKGRRG